MSRDTQSEALRSDTGLEEIVISYRMRRELAFGGQMRRYGDGAHSYLSVASYFTRFFEDNNVVVRQINRPELVYLGINNDGSAHRKPLHLSIKPAEEFRIAKGYTNISYIFWEFDKLLSDETVADEQRLMFDGMSDMKRALSIADKVWVACRYAQKSLMDGGIRSEVVPTPIAINNQRRYLDRELEKRAALSFLDRVYCYPWDFLVSRTFNDADQVSSVRLSMAAAVEPRLRHGAKVFFTLFNPLDPRKNIPLLVSGWREFRKRSKLDCSLFIKFSTPKGFQDALDIIKFHIPGMMKSYEVDTNLEAPDIYAIFDPIAERDMAYVRRLTDYYIATSFCEGQNLPLAEFTLAGALPICPRHTSLDDFVDREGALIIDSQRKTVPLGICHRYGFKDMHWFECDFDSYVSCLHSAMQLDTKAVEHRSQHAIKLINGYCGYDAVSEKLALAIR